MNRISPSTWDWMFLAGITALAAVLRLWQINESLWVDELHTSWCLQAGFWQVGERAAAGNQSPVYFYLLWGITRLLGESEFTLRLPSLLAGIALPGMTWLVVRKLWQGEEKEPSERNDARNRSAHFSAMLVAIDHPSVFYSTEARPYACVELLAVLVLLAAIQVIVRPSKAAPLWFMLTSSALFYFHYTSALYLAALMATLLIWALFRPSQDYNWQSWFIDVGGTAMICAPALAQLFEIASRRQNWSSFIDPPNLAALFANYPWIVVPACLLPLCFWKSARPIPRALPLVCTAAVVPVLLAWGLSYWKIAMLFHPRYVISALPVIWMAVATAALLPARPSFRIALLLAVTLLALSWSEVLENAAKSGSVRVGRQEDWRSAIAAAGEEHGQHPGWKILVHSGLIETEILRQPHDAAAREYGLLPVTALYQLAVPNEALIPLPLREPGKLTAQTRAEVLKAGGAIVILRYSAERAVAVENDLAESEVPKRQAFGDVQVLTVRIPGK